VHQLLAPARQGHPHGPKAHDGTIIPAQVDTMWGTDMTATSTRKDGQVAIFIAVDHDSAECGGIHAAKQGTRLAALEPIRQGVCTSFGVFEQGIAPGLALRHDHGSQYRSHVFQEELRFLGSTSSPAFVRAPEGNGCAERCIRTRKENLLWLTTCDTVEDLRLALHDPSLTVARYMILKLFISRGYRWYPMYLGGLSQNRSRSLLAG
jgi:hypothetical protein